MTPNTAALNEQRPPGELAALQRRILAALLLISIAWLWFFLPRSPIAAWVGTAFWLCGFIVMLAVELLVMQWVNRRDPVPRATWLELLLAWLGECRVAAQVFGWRQPFRPNAVPDNLNDPSLTGQRGVVFIHGLVCNRAFWTPWLARLQGTRHAYVAINLEPVFGSISAYVPLIDAAVKAVTQASGLPPILVCHSMGGVAARAWLATMHTEKYAAKDAAKEGDAPPVHSIVTIGSPHRGTWLARFGQSANAVQMREGSTWLAELDRWHEKRSSIPSLEPADPLWLCWYSNCDHIVFPASTATLPGADNRLVRGAAHVQLAFMPEVMDETLALLDGRRTTAGMFPDGRPQR